MNQEVDSGFVLAAIASFARESVASVPARGRDQLTVGRSRAGGERGIARGDRRRAVLQGESQLVGGDASGRVGALDVGERLQELAAEIPHAGESLAELLVGCGPGDELRLARAARGAAAGPARHRCRAPSRTRPGPPRPGGRAGRRGGRGSGSTLRSGGRWTARARAGPLASGNQRSKAVTIWVLTWTALPSSTMPMRHGRCRQPGELILERLELLAVGLDAERLGEGGHRVLDIDDRRAVADGFAGQVDQDQPGFFAVGQAELDELAGPRVDGGARLDAQDGAALLAVPFAHRLAGIAVRDAALALDRVQEIDAVGRSARMRAEASISLSCLRVSVRCCGGLVTGRLGSASGQVAVGAEPGLQGVFQDLLYLVGLDSLQLPLQRGPLDGFGDDRRGARVVNGTRVIFVVARTAVGSGQAGAAGFGFSP